MPIPFLRLLSVTSPGGTSSKYTLAASGHALLCFDSAGGSLLSKWSYLSPFSEHQGQEQTGDEDGDRPSKRRRLSEGDDEISDAASAEIIVDNESAQKPRRKKKLPPPPSIIKLAATTTEEYVIAVTGEDKTVRVLKLHEGRLEQISERQMPKKPSAITLTPDESSILVADKFGDVFALPLLVSEVAVAPKAENGKETPTEAKQFKPSATNLTVHTRKNRQALENQLKSKQQASQKKTLDFEHKLLLGHVSLLTDVVACQRSVNGSKRGYIITADRDEHIRISRGMPQAHIIDRYCLGHSNFVSKLLIPQSRPEALISGGGDNYVALWDWQVGREVMQAPLIEHVNTVRSSLPSVEKTVEDTHGDSGSSKAAVTGLYACPLASSEAGSEQVDILVTCEAVPAVFVFRLGSASLEYQQTLQLQGNPLDVAIDAPRQGILVAVDNLHQPGSTSAIRPPGPKAALVQAFGRTNSEGTWASGGGLAGLEHGISQWAAQAASAETDFAESGLGDGLSDVFYTIEHLRKKAGVEVEEDD